MPRAALVFDNLEQLEPEAMAWIGSLCEGHHGVLLTSRKTVPLEVAAIHVPLSDEECIETLRLTARRAFWTGLVDAAPILEEALS